MQKTATALAVCLALTCAPTLARAQDDPIMSSSQTSTASTSGGSDPASTNAESTGQVIISPFQATETGIVTSSEWTGAQLAASATAIGWVFLIVLVAAALLVALGVGIYLTVKAKAGDETAFRNYLRLNRHALNQQVVAGHGPVLTDLGDMFGVRAAYPAFAHIVRHNQGFIRPFLTNRALEDDEGAGTLSRFLVGALLRNNEVLAEWVAEGRVSLSVRPL